MIAISVAFLASLFLTLFMVRYSHLHAHVTADNDFSGIQKIHSSPVPRIGGVAVFLGVLAGILVKLFSDEKSGGLGMMLLATSIPAFAMGVVEDLSKRAGIAQRLLATAVSALLAGYLLNAWLVRLDLGIVDTWLAWAPFGVLFTAFAVAGVSNAFNLIDGNNGLAGMVAIIILMGIVYVASQVGDRSIMVSAYVLAAGIAGFLMLNYPKGLIFLGDGGAYLIGFMIAELSVLLVARNPQVSPWFPFLLVFYPIFEALFSIFRRIAIGKHPGLPDADHLHQLIFSRMERWVTGQDSMDNANALTSPFLWMITVVSAIPATIFWGNTSALMLFSLLFAAGYVVLYWRISRD
jgi:UDP-N-acetylmuramyl pentapeptide phosphotransferase/UDP-N-acetylglucosamine-1-phosphate transferase